MKTLAAAAIMFERLVSQASAKLLGEGARSVRFAWPSDEGRPQDFPAAVVWLAGLMGIPVGSSYRPPRRQDGGVDLVTWKSFPDGRPGFPILLTQVTLERNYVAKSADIDLRLWAGYLRFDIDPMTALAVPYVVSFKQSLCHLLRVAFTYCYDRHECTCSLGLGAALQKRISGPLMDRTDIQLDANGCLIRNHPRWRAAAIVFVASDLSLECHVKSLRDQTPDGLAGYDQFFGETIAEVVPLTREGIDRATKIRAPYSFPTPDAIHLAATEIANCGTVLDKLPSSLAVYDDQESRLTRGHTETYRRVVGAIFWCMCPFGPSSASMAAAEIGARC